MKKFTPTTGYVPIGEFFVCNCGVPLAKRMPSGYELMKRDQGQVVKVTTQVTNGTIKIKCEKCGRGLNTIDARDSIGLTDSVSLDSENKRDKMKE